MVVLHRDEEKFLTTVKKKRKVFNISGILRGPNYKNYLGTQHTGHTEGNKL